jgi:uncharacterized protein (TIGR03083 family)
MSDSPSGRGSAAASERDRLRELVEVWHDAATRASALLRSLDETDWSRPTDLPGWNVRAVASHLAHLESELAGFPQQQVEVPEAPHVRGLMGQFTEAGPVARAGWSTEDIVDELDRAVAHRYDELVAHPPTDGSAPGPGFAGLIGWSWETLLSNRPLDLWMHEQDIRRAVGRPGGYDSPAAAHVVGVFLQSLPYVLGKKAGAGPGQSVRVVVSGRQPADVTAVVGEDGRGAVAPSSTSPTVTVELDAEAFVVRCGGRRPPEEVPVRITGDADLGRRVFAGLATTP